MQRKWWILGLGVVLVGGAAASWFLMKEKEAPEAQPFATTQVRKGALVSSISGTGSIEAAERETIRAAQEGTVAEVFFEEGDEVKKGDLLIAFDQDDKEQQIRSKQLELQRQQLELEQLQLNFKKAAESGEEAQDSIRITIQKQELTVRELQADLDELLSEDDIDPIVAPMDGKLATFDVEPGDVLREDAEIGEVVNYAKMKIVVAVDELDIAKVELGQSAEVLVDALPDKTFAGQVAEIADEGTANNGVASFDVTVMLTEIDGLKAGMSAEASVVTAEKAEALYLPIDAVQSMRGQYFVLVPESEASAAGGGRPSGASDGAGPGSAEPGSAEPGGSGEGSGAAQGGRNGAPGAGTGTPGGEAAEAGEQAMRSGGAAAVQGQAGARRGAGGGGTLVPVEVGIHNEDSIEIVSGLAEGDEVIVPQTSASSMQRQANMGFGPGMGAYPAGGMGGGVRIQGGGGVRMQSGGRN